MTRAAHRVDGSAICVRWWLLLWLVGRRALSDVLLLLSAACGLCRVMGRLDFLLFVCVWAVCITREPAVAQRLRCWTVESKPAWLSALLLSPWLCLSFPATARLASALAATNVVRRLLPPVVLFGCAVPLVCRCSSEAADALTVSCDGAHGEGAQMSNTTSSCPEGPTATLCLLSSRIVQCDRCN